MQLSLGESCLSGSDTDGDASAIHAVSAEINCKRREEGCNLFIRIGIFHNLKTDKKCFANRQLVTVGAVIAS